MCFHIFGFLNVIELEQLHSDIKGRKWELTRPSQWLISCVCIMGADGESSYLYACINNRFSILYNLISRHLAPLPRSLPRPSDPPSRRLRGLQYLRRALRYVAM